MISGGASETAGPPLNKWAIAKRNVLANAPDEEGTAALRARGWGELTL